MIWIVLVLCVLAMLCLAMSCIALWYRGKWKESVHIEIDAVKERLKESDDRCELLRELNALSQKDILKLHDENIKLLNENVKLDGEIRQLRSKLPKRDSKGRFCKK